MSDKPKLKYHIVSGRNPRTGAALKRPVIVDRDILRTDQVVEYALNGGYVRGQFHDMRGALNGFIEAIQQLGRDGKSINLNDWLSIHGQLTGTVDETRQLSSKNGYRVAITALKELKRDVTDFSWTNVDDTGDLVKIEHVFYTGSAQDNVIRRGDDITVTGKNLLFNTELGDSLVFSWLEGESTKTATGMVTISGRYQMTIAWPEALAEVASNTAITLTLHSRNGVKDAAEQVATRTVTLIEAE